MYIYHEYVLGAALGHNKKGCHGAGGGGGRSGVVVVVGVGGGMRVVVHIYTRPACKSPSFPLLRAVKR